MHARNVTEKQIESFHKYLIREEKSPATVEKYLRDVRAFFAYTDGRAVTKEVVMAYKKHLQTENYAVRSINSMLASLNRILRRISVNLDCYAANTDRCGVVIRL